MMQFDQALLGRMAEASIDFGNRSFVRREHLRRFGFVRQDWHADRAKSLCTDEEWQLSCQIELEAAKEIAGSHGPYSQPLHGPSQGYESPLLKHLRQSREAAGFDRHWFNLGTTDQWRYQLGPGSQMLEQLFSRNDELAKQFKTKLSAELRAAWAKERENLAKTYSDLELGRNDTEVRGSGFGGKSPLPDHISNQLRHFDFSFSPHRSARWKSWLKQVGNGLHMRVLAGASNGEAAWHVLVCTSDTPQLPDGDLERLFRNEQVFEFRIVDSTSGARVFRRYATEAQLTASLLAFCEITCFELPSIERIVTQNFGLS